MPSGRRDARRRTRSHTPLGCRDATVWWMPASVFARRRRPRRQPVRARPVSLRVHATGAELRSCFLEGRFAQLVTGRPIAERGARLLAVTLANDVTQVGQAVERVGVL